MLTVRFSNGFSIQYNSANFVSRSEHYSDIYTKKSGTWIAQVPNEALIEATRPCEMYDAFDKHVPDKGREANRLVKIEFRLSSIERALLNIVQR